MHTHLLPNNRRSPLFLQVDSYGGSLQFTVRYHLGRGQSEPVPKPDVVIVGNGQKLFYRLQTPPDPFVANRRQVHFTEVSARGARDGGGKGGEGEHLSLAGTPVKTPCQMGHTLPIL